MAKEWLPHWASRCVKYQNRHRVVLATRLRCHRGKEPEQQLNKPEDKQNFLKCLHPLEVELFWNSTSFWGLLNGLFSIQVLHIAVLPPREILPPCLSDKVCDMIYLAFQEEGSGEDDTKREIYEPVNWKKS